MVKVPAAVEVPPPPVNPPAQAELAREKVAEAGLDDQVDILDAVVLCHDSAESADPDDANRELILEIDLRGAVADVGQQFFGLLASQSWRASAGNRVAHLGIAPCVAFAGH